MIVVSIRGNGENPDAVASLAADRCARGKKMLSPALQPNDDDDCLHYSSQA